MNGPAAMRNGAATTSHQPASPRSAGPTTTHSSSSSSSRSRNASTATTDSMVTTASAGVLSDEEQDLLALTSGIRNGSAASAGGGGGIKSEETIVHAGTLPAHLYDAYLPAWVAWMRRGLMRNLATESRWIAKLQHKYRNPRRDRYFVSTALLGTHSFFLIFLPLSFWLGSPYFGRGLINVLAMGVYTTSALKDLVCVPRPFSPPVVRLSVGTHHLEYGFPSTHSANAVSIALYCYLWIVDYRSAAAQAGQGGSGWLDSWLWEIFLSYYALSVVGGRIYAGMHSLTDCVAGSVMGALITLVQWWLFPLMEHCLNIPDWRVPAFIIPVGLAMVTFHPQPMDDCPCFEDAIAFIAVMMGVTLGRWFNVRNGLAQKYDHPLQPQPFQPYNPSLFFEKLSFVSEWSENHFGERSYITAFTRLITYGNKYVARGISAARTADDSWLGWAGRSLAMFVLGSIVILVVRIVVKAASKLVLPPIFRMVYGAIGFALPRRFYTPAQEYKSIPQDLHPVPSVLNLSNMGKAMVGGGGFEPNRALSPSPQPSPRVASPTSPQQEQIQPLSFLRAASPQPFLPRASSPLAQLRQPSSGATSALSDLSKGHASVPHRRAQFAIGDSSMSSSDASLSASLSTLPSRSATPPVNARSAAVGRQQQAQSSPLVENPLGARIPVPLTQSQGRHNVGLSIPGEDAPDKVAAAIRNKGSKDADIKRYDADVLTKVLTYSAIGLFGSAWLPVFFEHIGLIRP
ncbi:hypothetical protein V8E36_005904 [Tilletia maclaganii]